MRSRILGRRIINYRLDYDGIAHVLYEQTYSDGAILSWWDFAPCPACEGSGKVAPLGYMRETLGLELERDRVCMICQGKKYNFSRMKVGY